MDPLAQLNDIHMPEQIHNYPVAMGWWISAVLLIVFIVWAIIKYKKYRVIRVKQKQALLMLSNEDINNREILSTLKWAALQYYPRQKIASLYGESWLIFLQQTLAEKHQKQFNKLLTNKDAFSRIYQQNATKGDESESLLPLAKFWLTNALPPHSSFSKSAPISVTQGEKA